MKSKGEQELERVRDYQAIHLHLPCECLAKGMFGANCPRCTSLKNLEAARQEEPHE